MALGRTLHLAMALGGTRASSRGRARARLTGRGAWGPGDGALGAACLPEDMARQARACASEEAGRTFAEISWHEIT